MSKKILIVLFIILNISFISSNEIYVLQNGDTLYSLSKKYKTSLEEIVDINNIEDITSLSVGTSIEIPTTQEHNESEIKNKSYIVKKGDTLFSISKKFDLSLSNIMEYNNLKTDSIISLGQELNLVANNIIINSPSSNVLLENESIKVQNNNTVINSSSDDLVPYWPVKGDISNYSGRIQGVKIEGSSGDYIQAVSTGKVIWYDSFKGIGKVVLIEGDNGYDYLYGTKESLNVHMGVQISAGERLGRLQDNNTSIIFSVFKNGKPLSNISEAPR